MERIRHVQRLGDRLVEPDALDVSFVVLFDGWASDVLRFHSSLTLVGANWELVIVDNPVDDEATETFASLDHVVHLPLREGVGYGAGRNLGLRQATGRIACIVDTSVEVSGDLDLGRLDDPAVGLLGKWGVRTDDGFSFDEAPGPDVDGVEGYFMAMRRADVARTGLFDPKFRFYRNADIDFSYRVRAAGLRTVVDPSLALTRHEHRLWENTPDREELSRKNFARFRRHWYT
jgi:glycosyltransferase involved in cell wall biosynthesis